MAMNECNVKWWMVNQTVMFLIMIEIYIYIYKVGNEECALIAQNVAR